MSSSNVTIVINVFHTNAVSKGILEIMINLQNHFHVIHVKNIFLERTICYNILSYMNQNHTSVCTAKNSSAENLIFKDTLRIIIRYHSLMVEHLYQRTK